jgi:hypothetical protein
MAAAREQEAAMRTTRRTVASIGMLCLLATIGCGGQGSAPSEPGAATEAEPTLEEREAALAEREKEIELQEKEQQLAEREAALARQSQAPAARPATATTQAKPAAAEPANAQPVVVRIPAGTAFAVQITEPLSTATTTVGTAVEGRLAEDLVVDGRRVAAAGAAVHGTVATVVSAKKKIGGKAKLGLTFDRLELAHGEVATIAASTLEEGKSSTAQDAAKIGGGTAAGAILGHQIDDDKGKVIGGIIGGALGTLAATKTGAELELPADTVIAVVIDSDIDVRL